LFIYLYTEILTHQTYSFLSRACKGSSYVLIIRLRFKFLNVSIMQEIFQEILFQQVF